VLLERCPLSAESGHRFIKSCFHIHAPELLSEIFATTSARKKNPTNEKEFFFSKSTDTYPDHEDLRLHSSHAPPLLRIPPSVSEVLRASHVHCMNPNYLLALTCIWFIFCQQLLKIRRGINRNLGVTSCNGFHHELEVREQFRSGLRFLLLLIFGRSRRSDLGKSTANEQNTGKQLNQIQSSRTEEEKETHYNKRR
jgi:hypothetical protein